MKLNFGSIKAPGDYQNINWAISWGRIDICTEIPQIDKRMAFTNYDFVVGAKRIFRASGVFGAFVAQESGGWI